MVSDVEVLRELLGAAKVISWRTASTRAELEHALSAAISALETLERRNEARAHLSPMPRWDEPIPVAALEVREAQPKVESTELLEAAVMTTECMSMFPPDYPVVHLRGRELEWHRLAMLALGR